MSRMCVGALLIMPRLADIGWWQQQKICPLPWLTLPLELCQATCPADEQLAAVES